MALRGTSRPRDSRRVLPSTSKALATAVRAPFGDPPLSAGFDGRLALGRTTHGDRSSNRFETNTMNPIEGQYPQTAASTPAPALGAGGEGVEPRLEGLERGSGGL